MFNQLIMFYCFSCVKDFASLTSIIKLEQFQRRIWLKISKSSVLLKVFKNIKMDSFLHFQLLDFFIQNVVPKCLWHDFLPGTKQWSIREEGIQSRIPPGKIINKILLQISMILECKVCFWRETQLLFNIVVNKIL